jgi:hypothetical protein
MAFGVPPQGPQSPACHLLYCMIAYRLQAERLGDLDRDTECRWCGHRYRESGRGRLSATASAGAGTPAQSRPRPGQADTEHCRLGAIAEMPPGAATSTSMADPALSVSRLLRLACEPFCDEGGRTRISQ